MLKILKICECLRLRKRRVRLGELGGLRRFWLNNKFYMDRIIVLKKEKTALVVPEKKDVEVWTK
jgi:hypothetical protein